MFDQGMAQAFGFNHEAAIRSFERAAELDPNAAMPHWGKAWALGPNYNLDIDDPRAKAAYEAIAKARVARGRRRPSSEKRVRRSARACVTPPDLKADRAALARAYSQAMGELSRRYPDDLDAAAIYAESLMNLTPWKLWTLDGKPAANTEQIVTVLESVLLRNPNHLGANHYYIHAVEASRTPARALPSAQRLTTLAESVRASAPHARAHLRAHRRSCRRGGGERGGRRRRSPLSGRRAAERDVRNDVLPAQPAFPRRLAHDAGALRRRASRRPRAWRSISTRTPR